MTSKQCENIERQEHPHHISSLKRRRLLLASRSFQHKIWRRTKAFTKSKLLHANDSPHRIAIGFAVGMFVGLALVPFWGLHMVISAALAFVVRGNKVAAMAAAWVSNPITMPAIVWGAYELGRKVLSSTGDRHSIKEFMGLVGKWQSEGVFNSLFSSQFWQELFRGISNLAIELWVGCLAIGIVMSVASYFSVKSMVITYRLKHPHRRFR